MLKTTAQETLKCWRSQRPLKKSYSQVVITDILISGTPWSPRSTLPVTSTPDWWNRHLLSHLLQSLWVPYWHQKPSQNAYNCSGSKSSLNLRNCQRRTKTILAKHTLVCKHLNDLFGRTWIRVSAKYSVAFLLTFKRSRKSGYSLAPM